MTKIKKIIAEIKRLYEKNETYPKKDRDLINMGLYRGRKQALEMLLDFINSLPAEQQSEDMEEAFDEVLPNPNWYISNDGEDAYNVKQMEEMFCAGSQWQKEQTINKASKWLAGNVINYIWKSSRGGIGISDDFFIDFRKAMEDKQ